MLDEARPREERTAYANKVSRMVEIHREQIMEPMHQINRELCALLAELEREIEKIHDGDKKTKLQSWLSLSQEQYLCRRVAVNYFLRNEKLDEEMANLVLSENVVGGTHAPENIAEQCRALTQAAVAVKEAGDKDLKFNEARKKLNKELFGLLART